MSENKQEVEPWNDEANMTIEDRRGTFLKVLCILSWVYIGLELFSVVFGYIGGREKVLESISLSEDAKAKITGSSFWDNIARTAVEQSIIVLEKTVENFEQIYLGNFLAIVVGGMAVYLMYILKRNGFYLYILYSVIALGISAYFLGVSSIQGAAIISLAFIIMYAVNLKRMTA
ncbi:MAG: hypothetical protein AB8B72_04865 [Crocinitomicaceae bacterium]